MKLNLLPTYVGKGRLVYLAFFVGIVLTLVSAAISFQMIHSSKAQLDKVKEQAGEYEKPVNDAVAYAAAADNVVRPLGEIIRDTKLANEMDKHNSVYPAFYDKIFPYIPSFYRITSMQASPVSPDHVTLTLTGVIKTHQQYADLMLAMLRIPGSGPVTRSGFTPTAPFVPNVTAGDPNPSTLQPNEPALPKDPLQRLNALIGSGGVHQFRPTGNFGSGQPGERGPTPDEQVVTMIVTLPGQLQTPNPRSSLTVGGGGGPVLVRGGKGQAAGG
jgi:hypothetical protein